MSSLPVDFTAKMRALLGEEFDEFLECYENDKYQALRINSLKRADMEPDRIFKGIAKTAEKSQEEGPEGELFEEVPWAINGYYYAQKLRPGKHAYHEAGVYYIQEPSAMSAAALLAPKPGMRVLDLCAAPGGKTTQLAAYLKQEGILVSNEIHPARCRILSQNVERMGIRNAIVTNEDSQRLAEFFPSYFHAILVDAPCSGEGMFRKNPEAMEEWSADQVEVCAKRQQEILNNAAKMLMGGGTLVYSTCTFSPEENEQTMARFLAEHEEFEVLEEKTPYFSPGNPAWAGESVEPFIAGEMGKTFRLWPHKLHGEGHFVAVLKKAGEYAPIPEERKVLEEDRFKKEKGNKKGNQNKSGSVPDRQMQQALEEFVKTTLNQEAADWILSGTLTLFGDQLYRLPDGAPSLRGLKVLRAGLHIGEFKKNRFEPSHALALALGMTDVTCAVNMQLRGESEKDSKIAAFFRGESFFIEEEELGESNTTEKGWALICVDGFSVGWGKLLNRQVKNHYPKGLRKAVL